MRAVRPADSHLWTDYPMQACVLLHVREQDQQQQLSQVLWPSPGGGEVGGPALDLCVSEAELVWPAVRAELCQQGRV